MTKRYETLYIQPFPPHHKEKPLRYYEVRIGHKKPMETFLTLEEAAEYAFKYTDTLHFPRVKHTRPDPNNHSHWIKIKESEKEKLKQHAEADKKAVS
ncbi:hypothetical protein FAI40_03255 [Acetobacteraceae bacterium]|nr:hypothetical protein FAI40_03255 [Acetobacteraceae bacterium]